MGFGLLYVWCMVGHAVSCDGAFGLLARPFLTVQVCCYLEYDSTLCHVGCLAGAEC